MDFNYPIEQAFFIDLDGTLFEPKTDILMPRAKETITKLLENGNQIILISRRGDDWSYPHPFSKRATLEALEKNGIKYDQIIFNVHSGRWLIDDNPPVSKCAEENGLTLEMIQQK